MENFRNYLALLSKYVTNVVVCIKTPWEMMSSLLKYIKNLALALFRFSLKDSANYFIKNVSNKRDRRSKEVTFKLDVIGSTRIMKIL